VQVAILFLSFYLQRINGPYFLCTNADPDYVYLFNALNLATGVAPVHVDHPGTTLQLWGAAVLRGTHALAGRGDLAQDVVQRPEFYLTAISDTLIFGYATSLFYLGWVARRVGHGLGAALLLQLTNLVFLSTLPWLPRVNPELVILILGQWLGVALLKLVYGPPAATTHPRAAVGLGLLSGVAIVTKLSFLPLLLLGVLFFETGKARARFLAGVTAACVLLTLPAAARWMDLGSWIWRLLTRSGLHGVGTAGAPSLLDYVRWLYHFLTNYPQYTLLFAAAAAVAAWFWIGRQRQSPSPDLQLQGRALTALLAFHLLLLLMVAKFRRDYYIFPSFGLMMLTVLLAADLFRRRQNKALPAAVATVTWVLVAVLFTWQVLFRLPVVLHELKATKAQQAAVAEIAERLSAKYLVVRSIWSSSEAYAEFLGNVYTGNRYSPLLAQRYPDYVGWDSPLLANFNPGFLDDPGMVGKYLTFGRVLAGGNAASVEQLFTGRAGIIFQSGAPKTFEADPVALPPGFQLFPIFGSPDETLYWAGRDEAAPELLQLKMALRANLPKNAPAGRP